MKEAKFKKFLLFSLFVFSVLSFTISFAAPAQAAFWNRGGTKYKTFNVEVRVDYGPAGKPSIKETIEVEKGTTPKEAVSQVVPIQSGKTCCSFREILAIDGVAVDPAQNRWWTCWLNGSKKVSPRKTKLKAGDVVEWKYIQDEQ